MICALPETSVDIEMTFYISAVEQTDIKNDFVASRESLPTMFIVTPNDKKVSVWTKEAPSVQVCRSSILKF